MRIRLASSLSQIPGLAHGFFGRTGGVSEGIYRSLNCGPGSGDVPEHVEENRRRVRKALGGERLLTLYQTHSAKAVLVRESWEQGPKADAMASNVPGLALGILTADCAPVLLADRAARVIGAVHAGWKGALSGVIESALQTMEALGAKRLRIVAAIGPCIGQPNYEVGPEFHLRFIQADAANAHFFVASETPGHFRFDLSAYVANGLRKAGVAEVESMDACTYANEEDFFSFRRTTHRGERDYGRQISAIVLT